MLTEEEREHIRLSEEYRAELRARLGEPAPAKPSFFREHLAVPLVILVATALVSGLVVPVILGNLEDERRRFDLQSRLIEQLVGDDAAAQVALLRYDSQLADFLEESRNAEPARRAELEQELAEDRAACVDAMTKYLVERRGNIEWVRLHYGRSGPLDSYEAVTQRGVASCPKAASGRQVLDFGKWEEATHSLVDFVSKTRPRV